MKQIDKILDKVTDNDDMDKRYTYYDPYVGAYSATGESCQNGFLIKRKPYNFHGEAIDKLGILEDLLDVLGIDFNELFTILPKYVHDYTNDFEVIE